jgi:hypothetical protein
MKALLLALTLSLVTLPNQAQPAAKPEILGHVISPPGKPAKATAVLCYWQMKPGMEAFYKPDLPRHVQVDEQGDFKFEALDPSLLYQVLILAPGYKQLTVNNIDPSAGALSVRLVPTVPTNAPPGTFVRGRVKDAGGNPVPGALIKILGVTREGQMHWPAYGIDFYTISDDAGLFVVNGETPFVATEGVVEAAGFSKALFERWEPGSTIHEVTLIRGAAFKGRLVQAGKPVVNAEILIQNFGRESGSSEWHYFARTDSEGCFAFAHLPPNRSFSLYATMESLAGRGAVSRHQGQVQADGSTNDIGDLDLARAFMVAGRIHLSDGKPIPANARLRLTRTTMAGVMDSLSVTPNEDGSFSFPGVPAEPVTIYLRFPGYQLTPNDASLKSGSATNLTVVRDITDLLIEMKPRGRK